MDPTSGSECMSARACTTFKGGKKESSLNYCTAFDQGNTRPLREQEYKRRKKKKTT